MKQVVTVLLFFISTLIQAQNFENLWTGYFSYVSVKSISQGNDKIYAASENAIFTYDLSTQELGTISTVNGLSGEYITTIYYSEDHKYSLLDMKMDLLKL